MLQRVDLHKLVTLVAAHEKHSVELTEEQIEIIIEAVIEQLSKFDNTSVLTLLNDYREDGGDKYYF